MQSIFDSCVPRDEVLQGELREDIFAKKNTKAPSNLNRLQPRLNHTRDQS